MGFASVESPARLDGAAAGVACPEDGGEGVTGGESSARRASSVRADGEKSDVQVGAPGVEAVERSHALKSGVSRPSDSVKRCGSTLN